jgi:ribonuclease D
MTIRLHRGDLPGLSRYGSGAVAIDTETMGLDPRRDRLCVVQLSPGDSSADVVQMPSGGVSAPNLTKLLADQGVLKLFHFARFDLGILYKTLGVMPGPVYCTKIASRLARTYTDKHGLKDLVRELLGTDLSKQQQLSDWGAADLTDAQVAYAGQARCHAGPRGPRGPGGRLFPVPAGPGPARPRRLGRRGHFRPFLGSPSRPDAAAGPHLWTSMGAKSLTWLWGFLILPRRGGRKG